MCDMTELRDEIASCAVYFAPIAFRLGQEQKKSFFFVSQLLSIVSESLI